MRNWAIRSNLRYKDNEHRICFTDALTVPNSWPLFASFECGAGTAQQQYAGDIESLFELSCKTWPNLIFKCDYVRVVSSHVHLAWRHVALCACGGIFSVWVGGADSRCRFL